MARISRVWQDVTGIDIDARLLLNGRYPGLWSGYTVRFSIGSAAFVAESVLGCRGINFPCTVLVRNGQVSVLTPINKQDESNAQR